MQDGLAPTQGEGCFSLEGGAAQSSRVGLLVTAPPGARRQRAWSHVGKTKRSRGLALSPPQRDFTSSSSHLVSLPTEESDD